MEYPQAKHISILLAEQILELLHNSGASEIEKLVALSIAKTVVPVAIGSLYAKDVALSDQVDRGVVAAPDSTALS